MGGKRPDGDSRIAGVKAETVKQMREMHEGIASGRWKPTSDELARVRNQLEVLMWANLVELLEAAEKAEGAKAMEGVLEQMVSYGEGDSPSDEFWTDIVMAARLALDRYQLVGEAAVEGTDEVKL